MRNIVGFFPTYMRPPYSSCNPACEATLKDLGYHISFFDVDTDDYDNDSPLLIQNAKNNFAAQVSPSNRATDSFLVISHDIHEQTAHNLTGYMLDTLQAKGYRAVTMGECMGDPPANWYRTAGTVVVPPVCVTIILGIKLNLMLILHNSLLPHRQQRHQLPPRAHAPSVSALGAQRRWRHTPISMAVGLLLETVGTRVIHVGTQLRSPRTRTAKNTRTFVRNKKITASNVSIAAPKLAAS